MRRPRCFVVAALLTWSVLSTPVFADSPAELARALEAADRLADAARAAPAEPAAARTAAVDRALAAYDDLIRRRPGDPEWMPRVRRRKASLEKRAGRPRAALAEYDAILNGPARRRDRARALLDAAALLERGHDLAAAEARLRRVLDDYRDQVRARARAALARGRVLEKMHRRREAMSSYRYVVDKCDDQVREAIEAYDALALLALEDGERRAAARWLRRCRRRFEKRATRQDRFGAYVARLLGEMKAPARLAAGGAGGAGASPANKARTGDEKERARPP